MRNTLHTLQGNLQSQDQCLAKVLYLRIKVTLICLEQELGNDKGTGQKTGERHRWESEGLPFL
jgi:hypothetical protein